MKGRSLFYLYITIIFVSISLAGPLVYVSGAPGGVCAFWRLLLSSIMILPFWIRERYFSIIQIFSGVMLGLHMALWMESLFYIPIGVSTAIVVSYPIYSLFIDRYIFGERITMKHVIGVLVGVIGIFIFFYQSFHGILDPVGVLLALLAGFFASLYFSMGRYMRGRLGVGLISYIFPVYAVSSVIALIYVLAVGEELYGYPLTTYIYFILLAVIPMFGGHTLLNYLLKYYKTSMLTSIALLEPVGASLISYFFLNQVLGLEQIIGMILVIIGIFMVVGRE